MPNYQRKVVYLSDEQFHQLVNNGSITVDGVTVNFNEYDMYVTPQKDPIVTTEALAPEYPELTFPVAAGQHCIQNGNYYVTDSGISNSEVWTPAHWRQLTVGEELTKKRDAPDFLVTFTVTPETSTTTVISDKTIEEIGAAYDQGKTIRAVIKMQLEEGFDMESELLPVIIASYQPGTYMLIVTCMVNFELPMTIVVMGITGMGFQASILYNMTTPLNGNFQALGKRITFVGTPVDSGDAATKGYVDNVIPSVPVTVSGTTPSITGAANTRYICGECATLTITAPASGIIDVVFTSGSTPTVLTVTSAKANTTIKWANGFDPSSLDANTTYEINILDGEFGVVGSWT